MALVLTELKSLVEVKNTLETLKTMSRDYIIHPNEVTGLSLTAITTRRAGKQTLTNAAGTQLAERIGIPASHFNWLRDEHPAEAHSILQNHWDEYAQKSTKKTSLLIRSRELGGQSYARAVLSSRYGIDLNAIVKDILPNYLKKDGYTEYAITNSLTQYARDLEDREKQTMWELAVGKLVNGD